jgi:hypothetical protein
MTNLKASSTFFESNADVYMKNSLFSAAYALPTSYLITLVYSRSDLLAE